jgi:two-component system response regulator AtoC
VPIELPPLRDRRSDIKLLVEHFLEARFSARCTRKDVDLGRTADALVRRLRAVRLAGNVRELQNIVEYAFAVGRSPELGLTDLPPEWRGPARATVPAAVAAAPPAEVERVREALAATGGEVSAAAEKLGVSRATFWRMRKRLGL